ncbi:uncharacterized protein AB675_1137 [Cyphellophora attinorum]|uniref:2EXR domain-containing protein n=1 Tax=Cyphellophora attinorum TaxID=1664694 RepID=A0A0N1H6B8_9EURO|nr:uncharacterized protein AB675_1137 [Phialophora attinorum]KPI38224.1 hypothetical protein AB675_1137 [Phialophora attinorum]
MDEPLTSLLSTASDADATEFLSLPLEVRQMVYTHLFHGSRLIIDDPRRRSASYDERQRKRQDGSHKFKKPAGGASLPSILVACKSIRAEAILVFADSLTPYFYNHRAMNEDVKRHLTPYLACAQEAFIDDRDVEGLGLQLMTIMPRLRKVIINSPVWKETSMDLVWALQMWLPHAEVYESRGLRQERWAWHEERLCAKLHRQYARTRAWRWLQQLADQQKRETGVRDLPFQILVNPEGYAISCQAHGISNLTVSVRCP